MIANTETQLAKISRFASMLPPLTLVKPSICSDIQGGYWLVPKGSGHSRVEIGHIWVKNR